MASNDQGGEPDVLMDLGARATYFKQALRDKLIEHKQYVRTHGDDMPEIARCRRLALEPAAAGWYPDFMIHD